MESANVFWESGAENSKRTVCAKAASLRLMPASQARAPPSRTAHALRCAPAAADAGAARQEGMAETRARAKKCARSTAGLC